MHVAVGKVFSQQLALLSLTDKWKKIGKAILMDLPKAFDIKAVSNSFLVI